MVLLGCRDAEVLTVLPRGRSLYPGVRQRRIPAKSRRFPSCAGVTPQSVPSGASSGRKPLLDSAPDRQPPVRTRLNAVKENHP